jgi:hypothetical protein
MSAAKNIEALITVLDGSTPDLSAIDESLTLLGVLLHHQSKRDYRALRLLDRDGRTLVLGNRGEALVHQGRTTDGDTRGAIVASRDNGGRITIPAAFRDASKDGAIVIPASSATYNGLPHDAGYRWPWAELALALSSALRALPSRARTPRPIACPHCHREFYR